jgi:hypothetical protein
MLLLHYNAPFAALRPLIAPLFRVADEELCRELSHAVYSVGHSKEGEAMLREVLPGVTDPELRDAIEQCLGIPTEAERYWQDPTDPTDPAD